MPNYLKPPTTERELFPDGNHRLYLYSLVFLGTMPSRNPSWSPRPSYLFQFEAPDLPFKKFSENKPEQPLAISRRLYGDSATEFYTELRDGQLTPEEKEFGWNPEFIIGKLFKVQVLHEQSKSNASKTYANISKVREPLIPAPTDVKPMTNPKNVFWCGMNFATSEPYQTAEEMVGSPNFKALPEWIQNEVKKSVEFTSFPDAAKFPIVEKNG